MTSLTTDAPIKLERSIKRRHGSGGFGIEILWPGLAGDGDDSGVGTIGRIDHAHVLPGTLIAMHPHRDDEILTYLRSGRVLHSDSEGHTSEVSNKRLMLMGAGRRFEHEEQVQPGEELTGLQIFLRPSVGGLPPQVRFRDLEDVFNKDAWRLLASPHAGEVLQVRSRSWVHDVRLSEGVPLVLPAVEAASPLHLVYVFDGRISVAGLTLVTGESALVSTEATINAEQTSDLVVFTTDLASTVFKGGMFSGNQRAQVDDKRFVNRESEKLEPSPGN